MQVIWVFTCEVVIPGEMLEVGYPKRKSNVHFLFTVLHWFLMLGRGEFANNFTNAFVCICVVLIAVGGAMVTGSVVGQ